jgi:hypothetical protein
MVVANADGDLSTQAIGTGPAGPAGADGSDATNYWIESGSDIYRSTGNVGIGTTNPSYKLDVFGNINSTGTVTASSFAGIHNGPVTGNVTGDVTGTTYGVHNGPVTGNVTGDLTGTTYGIHSGHVSGDVFGDHIGPVTGNVTGNVTGDVVGNTYGVHNGPVTGNVTGDVFGTAERLTTIRAICGVDFDGSAAIDFMGTAPTTATAIGTAGTIIIDADYIYICTATNMWKRVAISTW